MKKISLVLFVVLACATAVAQAHTATLTWDASPSAASSPTLTYNIYRADVPCPTVPLTLTKVGSTQPGVLTFTDPLPLTVATTCYKVTAQVGSLESVGAFVNATADLTPAAPGNLKVTTN